MWERRENIEKESFDFEEQKMKFRAKMTDHYAIKQFHNIMVSMTRLSKQCYLRLTKDSFYFIADDYSSIGGASVWCEMEYDKFFKECVQEGVTEEDPDIYIQVSVLSISVSAEKLIFPSNHTIFLRIPASSWSFNANISSDQNYQFYFHQVLKN